MNSIIRICRESQSLLRRSSSISHYVNPHFYYVSSCSFSVRTIMFESTHQVPKDQQVNRLKPGHSMATTKDSTLVKEAVCIWIHYVLHANTQK